LGVECYFVSMLHSYEFNLTTAHPHTSDSCHSPPQHSSKSCCWVALPKVLPHENIQVRAGFAQCRTHTAAISGLLPPKTKLDPANQLKYRPSFVFFSSGLLWGTRLGLFGLQVASNNSLEIKDGRMDGWRLHAGQDTFTFLVVGAWKQPPKVHPPSLQGLLFGCCENV
jgi:hypothetical protein